MRPEPLPPPRRGLRRGLRPTFRKALCKTLRKAFFFSLPLALLRLLSAAFFERFDQSFPEIVRYNHNRVWSFDCQQGQPCGSYGVDTYALRDGQDS